MEPLFALLAICEGNPQVIGGFPQQRASNTTFNVFIDFSLKTVEQTAECGVIVMSKAVALEDVVIRLWRPPVLSVMPELVSRQFEDQ